ncbi:hypothetical protein [Luteolibacter soli]|uniref:PEP-CTERM protein-sorting domain-containing protein n=1 Tax=Luteolibacter soli TaxID=3135280 RepID=A0ABU9AMM5_9BACT
MKNLLLSAGCLSLLASSAHAALVAGDLSVIGFRADATDSVAFVVWTTVNAGESIYFTDSGYFSDGTMRDSEDRMTWTAPTGGITAGTVIVIGSTDAQPNGTANIGTVTGRLNGLSASGDQVFVGTTAFPGASDTTMPGSTYSGTLLFGLDFAGATGWATTATGTNDSALPSVINSLGLNIGFADIDNGQFIGARTGMTIDQYKAAIVNAANWTTNDDGVAFGNLSTTAFTIVPEPAAAMLGSLGMLGLLRRRRVR